MLLEWPKIHDELVGAHAGRATEENLVVILEALGHVVCVEDRELGRFGEARLAEHLDVHPRDREDGRRTKRRGRNGTAGLGNHVGTLATGREHDVARQVRGEVLGDTDRADARAAAAVRDAEGLVKVEVAHVGANNARRGHAHLRVHVRAVHVNLAAVIVDKVADVLNALLEHAVRRGVGGHESGKVTRVLLNLRREVVVVDVAVVEGLHGHHLVTGHHGRGRVSAVGRHRDQADVAVALTARLLPRFDRKEAGVLALGARVGLRRDRSKAGDLGEVLV
mmetsp:Transcript_85085/g.241156  ORF Transcript_85085/g.241156 Transcript_85085/m.241156 type:complete len:279 (+) Transcript_85085:905-1741(+)